MSSLPPGFLFLAAIAAFLGLIIYKAVQQSHRREEFFNGLAAFGGAGEGTNRLFSVAGHEVRTDFYAGGKNTPSRFSLVTAVEAQGSFTVVREGAADRFFENLGLEGKIATHDAPFDEKFHIVSDDEVFAAAYFSAPAKREAIYHLFARGCARVELSGDGLKVVWTPFQVDGMGVSFVKESLPRIAVLAEDLPKGLPFTLPSGVTKKQFDRIFGAAFVAGMIAFVGLPILAQTHRFTPLDASAVFWYSVRYSGPALAAYALLVFSLLKGRSWFLRGLVQSVFLGALFFPYGGYWAALWVNCSLDDGPPSTHTARIDMKYTRSGKNATRYHVRLVSWRDPRRTHNVGVSRATYDQLQPGWWVAVVTTKPGRLGLEWVLGYQFQPSARWN